MNLPCRSATRSSCRWNSGRWRTRRGTSTRYCLRTWWIHIKNIKIITLFDLTWIFYRYFSSLFRRWTATHSITTCAAVLWKRLRAWLWIPLGQFYKRVLHYWQVCMLSKYIVFKVTKIESFYFLFNYVYFKSDNFLSIKLSY